MGRIDHKRTSGSKLLPHGIHRCQIQVAVFLLHDFLNHQIACPGSHILGGGRRLGSPCPANHVGVLAVFHMLGGIEQLTLQPLGSAVGTVLVV